MTESVFKNRVIISEIPTVEFSDSSSGSAFSETTIIKKVITSRNSDQVSHNFFSINKKLNSKYIVTGDSASRARSNK